MHTLQVIGNVREVALWLGHASIDSTEAYLHADPSEKLEALTKMMSPTLTRGHFRPPDMLMTMLKTSTTS